MDTLNDERAGALPVGPSGDRSDCASDSFEAASAGAVLAAESPPPALWTRIERALVREGIIRR